MLGLGCACLPLCVTKGKPLESVGPHTAEPGLGEIFSTGLEMWFHLPWLEVSPHFLRLSLGEGRPEGWCMVVCRSQVPFRLWKVVVPGGTCGAGQGGQRKSSSVKQQHSAIGHRAVPSGPGGLWGHWWLLRREMWKVSRALLGGRERSWPFHQERAGELGRRGVSSDSSPGWPRGDLLHVAQAPEESVPLLGAPVVCMAGVSVRCMRRAAQGPAGKRGWIRGRSVW